MAENSLDVHKSKSEPWQVTLIDTGPNTMTGGRLKRIRSYVGDEPCFMTYGDGLSDVNIDDLLRCHKEGGKLCTVTATQPPGRFGALDISPDKIVREFAEKPTGDGSWINGGFFVLEPEVFEYIENDQTTWEQEPLRRLANKEQLIGYRHSGFWQPMDTLREKNLLEDLWIENKAPWKIWND